MICRKSDNDSIQKCISSLKNGGVVIIPTDTVYGFSGIVDEIACDEKVDDNEKGGFEDSLILNDFEDEDDYSSFGIGSMSNYLEGKIFEEQERLYRQSQMLEEEGERETYL